MRSARGLNIFEIIWIGAAIAVLLEATSWVASYTGWRIPLAAGAITVILLLPLVLLHVIRRNR